MTGTRPFPGRKECVALSIAIARLGDLPAGMLAGCERLVHAGVDDAATRERHRRLIAVLLSAPFGLAVAAALALLPQAGIAIYLAAMCGTTALFWTMAVTVALTGRSAVVERVALAVSVVALAGLAHAGGLAALALAPAITVETVWVARSRRALALGIVAMIAVLPLAGIAGIAADSSLALWLVPALYGLVAAPRIQAFLDAEGADSQAVATVEPGSWIELTPAGRVLRVSADAATLFGIEVGEFVDENAGDRIHLRDRLPFMTALADLRENVAAERTIDLRLGVPAVGEGRFMPVRVTLSMPHAGHVRARVEDRRDHADLEAELRAALARADEVEVAKGRFLAAVSHELRTPLNSIIGFSDMMLHGLAGPVGDARQTEYMTLIRNSGNHLLSVVNAILDVSKIESGAYAIQAEPFRLRDALVLCHSMLAHQANAKGIRLELGMRDDIGELVADRRAVQQIVINLLSNAIKFTPSGGTVRLDAVRIGQKLKLSVADNGIGIAADDLGRLCKPFAQVRNELTREHEGTGLGLSLVKGLVRLHEGEMDIESAPGDGTTVSVTLPLDGPRAGRGEIVEGGIRPAPGKWNEEASEETPRKRA